jgi:hypothetical protein
MLPLSGSWYEMGNFCINNMAGLVATDSSNISNVSDVPKGKENTLISFVIVVVGMG